MSGSLDVAIAKKSTKLSNCVKAQRKLTRDTNKHAKAKKLAKDRKRVVRACAVKKHAGKKKRPVGPNGRPIPPAVARRCAEQPSKPICRRNGY